MELNKYIYLHIFEYLYILYLISEMVYILKEQICSLQYYLRKFFNFYISSSLKASLSEMVKGFAFFFP